MPNGGWSVRDEETWETLFSGDEQECRAIVDNPIPGDQQRTVLVYTAPHCILKSRPPGSEMKAAA